jgi:hypothetical protein
MPGTVNTTIQSSGFHDKAARDTFYRQLKSEGMKHIVRYTTHERTTVRRIVDAPVWDAAAKEVKTVKVEQDFVQYDPRILYVVAWQEPVQTLPLTEGGDSDKVDEKEETSEPTGSANSVGEPVTEVSDSVTSPSVVAEDGKRDIPI